jgi:hypothetical protein
MRGNSPPASIARRMRVTYPYLSGVIDRELYADDEIFAELLRSNPMPPGADVARWTAAAKLAAETTHLTLALASFGNRWQRAREGREI